MEPDNVNPLASDVAMALSDGINGLFELLQHLDAGTSANVDRARLESSLNALEKAAKELVEGVKNGRMQGGPPLTEADLVSLHHLRARLTEWSSSGKLPSDLGDLAEQCIVALAGMNWRDTLQSSRP